MRFWHKTYLCILIIFLIAFDTGAYLLMQKAYDINEKSNTKSGISEFLAVSQITKISLSTYENHSDKDVLPLLKSIAENYRQQDIYMEFYEDNTMLFSNFLEFSDDRKELKSDNISTVYRTINNKFYLFTSGKLENNRYTLVIIRNSDFLIKYYNELLQYFIIISIIISIILSVLLVLALLKLTRPFHKLNLVANEIADGNYNMFVEINSNDEIGEFAKTFNKMANAIAHHVDELKLSNEQKERFSNNLTHELKTPIATIKGYSELLCKANVTEEEKIKAYNYIYEHSLRLQNLTQKLMDLIYLQKETISIQEISVNYLFDEIIKLLDKNLKSKNINIEINISEDTILGDEILIQSLLINLVENAIKASHNGAKIVLCSRKPAIIEITDFGVGIPENEIKKITEEFYRVDKSRSRESGGIGLGLSICKQIMDLHGGNMNITSSVDKFTTIKLVFTTI
jgi:signal transduction histidine kinase